MPSGEMASIRAAIPAVLQIRCRLTVSAAA
jgi:hypothetical protein